jgi:hypothetical protein
MEISEALVAETGKGKGGSMKYSVALKRGLACLFAATLVPVHAQDKPTTEKQKIEALIKHVEELKDARFVRNDTEYDAKTAARFLRGKWEANAASIKTAKEFIEKAASVSSTTGKPYLIRFKDGRQIKSGEYLLTELKRLEKS